MLLRRIRLIPKSGSPTNGGPQMNIILSIQRSVGYVSRLTPWCVLLLATVVPFAVVAPATAQTPITGLDFPGSAAVSDTMRFRFVRPDQNGLPIYGPSNAGVTYIWRAYPRRQGGYYTTFFWGNDGTFTWSNGGASTYYGAHPYPWPDDPPGGRTHQWQIAADGFDILNGAVVYDRWHTQALRVWADAAGKHHEFYWDLPNTDATHRVSYVGHSSWNNVNPPAPALTWGDAPWAPGQEVYSGVLRGIQIYAANLTLVDLLSEVASPLSTAAGASSVWYLNLNPTPSDISDQSGRGHNPAWVGSARPALYAENPGSLIAANDNYAVQSGILLTVAAPGVLTNDSNPNGGSLSVILISGTTHGTLTLNSNGSFSYIPNSAFTGTDTFTYQASNGTVQSNLGTVTLTVSSTNRPPVATNDAYAAQASSTLTVPSPGVLINDTDPDGGSLTTVLASGTTNGILTLNPNGSFTYVPNAGFAGSDSFSYRASDGVLQSTPVTVILTVTSGNQVPVAASDTYAGPAGSALAVAAPGVLSNDTEPDGGSLSAILVTATTNGTLTLNPSGSFTYVPNAGFTGSDVFSYRASDGALQSNTVTVTLMINASTGPFTVSPSAMTYTGTVNGPNQNAGVTIKNNRSTSLNVTWSDNINWLVATSGDIVTIPPGGSAVIIHTASMAGLSPGTYTGTATVRGGGVTQRITVTLKVN
jgi:hypothetical protein